MNFNFYLVKSFRILLFPFALIYWMIITVRNWMYNKGYYRSAVFNMPVICVGNISAGGTGKSPMVEYLLRLLTPSFKVATVSRGYKRKTKGYVLAGNQTTALEIGDEPMQFHLKFPHVPVAVGEERIVAIPQLLHDKPDTQVIVLDDAFQHRRVKAGFNILLTECSNLYTRDWYLPTGDLRDNKSSAARAQVIIVTKCPPEMSAEERAKMLAELKPLAGQAVYFSTISYGKPYHIENRTETELSAGSEVLLVCGIANPKPLKQYIEKHTATYQERIYGDHHIFTIDDLKEIKDRFTKLENKQKIILTTEKDAVRLVKFEKELETIPLYVLPIEHKILFNETEKFNQQVKDFITNFNK